MTVQQIITPSTKVLADTGITGIMLIMLITFYTFNTNLPAADSSTCCSPEFRIDDGTDDDEGTHNIYDDSNEDARWEGLTYFLTILLYPQIFYIVFQ